MVNTITISGLPGSGTTTVAEFLQKKLGWKHINMGKIFRELAEENRMKLQEFEEYCEENPRIDREIDKKQEKFLKEGNVILESRLAGWIAHLKRIPAFKVWLDCQEEERVRRIINREDGDFFEKKAEMKAREKSEKRRYKKFYGIDLDDKSIYDVIIDTTNLKPEEIADRILSMIQK